MPLISKTRLHGASNVRGSERGLHPSATIIAVMGPTGSGKSTFINGAMGRHVSPVSNGLNSCTQKIQAFRCVHPGTQQAVTLVDTPGFDDGVHSDAEILKHLAQWLKDTFEKGIMLAGVIYLHRITDKRMAKAPLRNLQMFYQLCGENALQNVVLTTTMWGAKLDAETGLQRERQLQDQFWRPMLDKGSATARFLNSTESAWSVVHCITEKTHPTPLQLQHEMVELHKPLSQTEAGRVLYKHLQELANQNLLAEEHLDSDPTPEMLAQYEEIQAEIRRTLDEVQCHQVNLSQCILRFFTFRYFCKNH